MVLPKIITYILFLNYGQFHLITIQCLLTPNVFFKCIFKKKQIYKTSTFGSTNQKKLILKIVKIKLIYKNIDNNKIKSEIQHWWCAKEKSDCDLVITKPKLHNTSEILN